ncbi:MAG TPA: ribulose-phosphate 3-epimerase [Tepidisphaeraceae bacterium]|nr:ribulose-phosphate 3-epimerase [Tepidisphaeraceae bacterium]
MTSDPYASASPQICASILSADFAKLAAEIDDVDRGGVDFLHLDVMDGHFVPNISFGPALCAATRRSTRAYLDAHLMIDEPVRYAPAFAKAGVNGITFHVEAVRDPVAAAKEIRALGLHVGITSRPATPIDAILPALDHVDLVLVMSVNPGFSGQKFMPESLARAEAIRKRLRPGQRLQIDGGINPQTIRQAREAGVDWFVAASAIFDGPDRAAAIRELRAGAGMGEVAR